MVTVWKRITKYGDRKEYTSITKVDLTGEGAVHVAAWSVGPRGGSSTGWPGFTAAEWAEITAAVKAKRCYEHGANAELLYPGGDSLYGWGCLACFNRDLLPTTAAQLKEGN